MKELVERQYRNVERAFTLNTGPYEVSPDYISHQEDTSKWTVTKNLVPPQNCSPGPFLVKLKLDPRY